MLELLVLLLCGSILASGLLAVCLQQSDGGDGERRAGEPVRRGLLRAARRRPTSRWRKLSIGSGLSTLIFLYAIRRTRGCEGVSAWPELIGSILILLGAFFLFSAGSGMLRMPDAFTRIQAGTKASTLGNMLVLAGIAFYHPGWSLKLADRHLFRPDDQPDLLARAGAGRSCHRHSDGADDRDRRAARRQARRTRVPAMMRRALSLSSRWRCSRFSSRDLPSSIPSGNRCGRWPQATSRWCRRSSARPTSSPASC